MKSNIQITIAAALLSVLLYNSLDFSAQKNIPPHVIEAYSNWKREHMSFYSSPSEDNYRLQIFYETYQEVEDVNSQNLEWQAGLNQFSAMSYEEFSTKYLGAEEPQYDADVVTEEINLYASSVDWVKKGKVNSVQSQGSCGSCWAFATVASAESSAAIKTGSLKKYSEQQILDCVTANGGCNGGRTRPVFDYLKKTGLISAKSYPYKKVRGSCRAGKISGTKSKTFTSLKRHSSSSAGIKSGLSSAPVIVWMSTNKAFKNYKSGTFSDTSCKSAQGFHFILLTGYGSGYFRGRNSWGTRWGSSGYVNIKDISGSTGICNIYRYPETLIY